MNLQRCPKTDMVEQFLCLPAPFPALLHPSALLPDVANSEHIFQTLPHPHFPWSLKSEMREKQWTCFRLTGSFALHWLRLLKGIRLVNFLVKPICINMTKIKAHLPEQHRIKRITELERWKGPRESSSLLPFLQWEMTAEWNVVGSKFKACLCHLLAEWPLNRLHVLYLSFLICKKKVNDSIYLRAEGKIQWDSSRKLMRIMPYKSEV